MTGYTASLRLCLMTTCAAVAGFSASAGHAQTPTPPPVSQVDEIVVTALKQGASAMDTPATVKIIDEQVLVSANVTSARDLGGIVPGFTFMQGTAGGSASFRGLGSNSADPAIESSVGAFNDGLYLGHVRDFTTPLYDIQQIEFISGTQSTVLGKNTSLGALSIASRRPGRTFGFDGSVTGTSEIDGLTVRAAMDVPLGERFAVRFAGFYNDEQGYTRNDFLGRDEQQLRDLSGRIVLDGDIGATGRLTVLYQHDQRRGDGQYLELLNDPDGLAQGFAQMLGQPDFDGEGDDRTLNGSDRLIPGALDAPLPHDDQDTDRAMALFETEIGAGLALTAQTSWMKWDSARRLDQDYTNVLALDQLDDEANEVFSQELRLASPAEDRFSYIVGLYFYHNDYSVRRRFESDLGEDLDANARIKTDFYSAFVSARYRMTDQLAVLGGVRQAWEDKTPTYDISGSLAVPIAPVTLATTNQSNTDYNIGAEYAVRDNVMVYATYARGSKNGGFQSIPSLVSLAEYGTEVAQSIEIGAKYDLGRRAALEIAVFDTRVNDFQTGRLVTIPGFPLPLTQIANVDARTTGAEATGRWTLSPSLSVSGTVVYADSRFTQGLLNEVSPGVFRDEIYDGMPLPRAPLWSGELGLDYDTSLGRDFTLSVSGKLRYADDADLQLRANNPSAPKSDAHTLLSLEVRLGKPSAGWSVALIGNNLTDERYATFASDYLLSGFVDPTATPAYYGNRNRPRTISLQLAYGF